MDELLNDEKISLDEIQYIKSKLETKVNEIEEMRAKGYDPHVPYNSVEGLKKIVDSLIDGTFNDLGTGIYGTIHRSLMENAPWHQADQYFVLEDFEAYKVAQANINRSYQNRLQWSRRCLANIANSSFFSSDRTIQQYVDDVWKLDKVN